MTYVAFVASAAGSGGTITTSFTNASGFLDFSQSGSLDLFNPALGTLVSATLRLTLHYDMTGTVSLSPGGSPPYDVLLAEFCDMDASSSLTALDSILSATSPLISDYVLTPTFSIDAGNSPHTFATLYSSPFIDIDLASILANLTGVGTFSVSAYSFSGLGLSGGSGYVNASASAHGGFDALLTYTYT